MNTENPSAHEPKSHAKTEFAKASLVTAVVTGTGLPVIRYTNLLLAGKTPQLKPLRLWWGGALPLSTCTAVTYLGNRCLETSLDKMNVSTTPLVSLSAGAASGLIATPLESLMQKIHLDREQGKPTTTWQILKTLHHQKKLSRLQRGSMVTAGREALWSAACYYAPAKISGLLQDRNVPKPMADMLGLIISGVSFGVYSAPLNKLRHAKQLSLLTVNKPLSYSRLISQVKEQEGLRGMFRGALARGIGTGVIAISLGLMLNALNPKAEECSDCPGETPRP